jgi:hypothetical protein
MKMILAGVAFAALLGTSVFAHQLRTHEQPAAGIYPNDEQVRGDSRDRLLFLPSQPAPNRYPMTKVLCDTAHDFCAGFHGDNG